MYLELYWMYLGQESDGLTTETHQSWFALGIIGWTLTDHLQSSLNTYSIRYRLRGNALYMKIIVFFNPDSDESSRMFLDSLWFLTPRDYEAGVYMFLPS